MSTTAAAVEFWDAEYAEYPIPATIAHFERIPEGLPPDPGEAGMETLVGIDSDDDGLRDDIEIGIAAIGFESEEETDSAMQFAMAVDCASAVFGGTAVGPVNAEEEEPLACGGKITNIYFGNGVAVTRAGARVARNALITAYAADLKEDAHDDEARFVFGMTYNPTRYLEDLREVYL